MCYTRVEAEVSVGTSNLNRLREGTDKITTTYARPDICTSMTANCTAIIKRNWGRPETLPRKILNIYELK